MSGKKHKESQSEDSKPWMVFRFCGKTPCAGPTKCGWFWGEGNETKFGEPVEYPRAMPDQYTAKSVKEDLDWKLPTEVGTPPHQTWYKIWAAELKVGKSDNWSCDQRTKDLYVLHQYIMAELKGLGCPDEDRRFVQNFFNRKSRAEDDLYALAAVAINSFLNDTIERYRGR